MPLNLTRYIASIDKIAMLSITDLSGRISMVNHNFCEGFGYTEEELLGKNHRLLKSSVHSKVFFTDLWGVLIRGDIWYGEICNQKKDGSLCWTDATIGPHINSNGDKDGYFSLKIDITERKNKIISRTELFEISTLAEIRLCLIKRLPPDQVCQKIIQTIQESMSASQPVQVLILLDGKELKSIDYESMFDSRSNREPIIANGIERGSIEVRTKLIGDSISPRNRKVINRISTELGNFISHQETSLKLEQITEELQISNRDLTNSVKNHTSSQRMLEESRELLRKLISHQEEVRDEEARRIAKEVHDDLGSELIGIKSYLWKH